MISDKLFFLADDWAWLYFAKYQSLDLRTFLIPNLFYNDRPTGKVAIKLLYYFYNLNYRNFTLILVIVHGINSYLTYRLLNFHFARPISLFTALVGSLWLICNSAVGWLGAVFDLLACTFSLLTLIFYSKYITAKSNQILNLCLCCLSFIFAIRSKEFALSLIFILLCYHIFFYFSSIRKTLKQIAPLILIFTYYSVVYFQLYLKIKNANTDFGVYKFDLSLLGILNNANYYLHKSLYGEIIGNTYYVIISIITLAATFRLNLQQLKLFAFGIISYYLLLGPTILLSNHLDILYTYTSKFFLAFTLGSLISSTAIPSIIGLLLSLYILITPYVTDLRKNIIFFNTEKRKIAQIQYNNIRNLLTGLNKGASIFISGVEPYFNVFSYGSGHSLRLLLDDPTLKVELEKEFNELRNKFCNLPKTGGDKIFIDFIGNEAKDISKDVESSCS